ncbi:putative oligonucleotidase [Helianthus annuus]|uniref:Oligonucleotidase n=2 Tax=Helianthus annuus TaxID=4232 RepID=A0A9K3IGC9_HELAN|nr:oligoribonuclease [Helianthus annuus]XP_021978023.1 oligoribonuclease [Helianthus annuus]XP_035831769.1 oligoribonuclease [Helianthus annuus]KAF5796105.1 putative oligonucleotidase [Helianthus annuus]KAJ0547683.1 putative oligonucleotidase [Helianthus annuus]KAJ0554210.1 putative oligonucleotidase [Helianthus annuus]KAJ0719813.1 putative oligonucleotidase [Helianthus annuus]KAJ0723038.1 putative oligonucleotidase [Helianthus annuus]
MSRRYYKLPLVWIKLQKTGLNVEVDRILEIACVITDGKLRKLVEGPDLVIHQTKDFLEEVGEWCQDRHACNDDKKAPKKKRHGAVLDEIKESITELKYYKEHAFRSPKSKR